MTGELESLPDEADVKAVARGGAARKRCDGRKVGAMA